MDTQFVIICLLTFVIHLVGTLAYGKRTIELDVAKSPQPTVANGFKILRDCRQPPPHATEYSNIYDLKTGDIFLYPYPGRDDEVKFNLAAELKKGAHYYDMPQIHEELAQAPRPLLINMKRFPLDEYKPIPDQEPKVTAHLREMIRDMSSGTMHEEDFAAEGWKKARPKLKEIQTEAKLLGDLVSMSLVGRSDADEQRSYRYRLEFAKATILERFVFDSQCKLASAAVEAAEWKPGANFAESPEETIIGIGVVLRGEGQNIIIQEIVPDSPAAAQKDIHPGDRIVAVAQDRGPAVPVESGKIAQAVTLIHGPAGTTVRLTIVPSGESGAHARVVSLVRAELKAPPY
jgi:PDZ domain